MRKAVESPIKGSESPVKAKSAKKKEEMDYSVSSDSRSKQTNSNT
jgi:hypothetical protein